MNPWMLAFALGFPAGAYPSTARVDPVPRPRTLAEFAARLDRLRSQLGIPGMSAIVIVHDSVVWEGSLGFADVSTRKRVTPETRFHLASLTKTFASTIVMQLVEQGLVRLDDPIGDYGLTLPASGVVRVRHLARTYGGFFCRPFAAQAPLGLSRAGAQPEKARHRQR